jgi:hypothetical protein
LAGAPVGSTQLNPASPASAELRQTVRGLQRHLSTDHRDPNRAPLDRELLTRHIGGDEQIEAGVGRKAHARAQVVAGERRRRDREHGQCGIAKEQLNRAVGRAHHHPLANISLRQDLRAAGDLPARWDLDGEGVSAGVGVGRPLLMGLGDPVPGTAGGGGGEGDQHQRGDGGGSQPMCNHRAPHGLADRG